MTAMAASAKTAEATTDLVVFDGVCVLCNGFARFVDRHDRAGRVRFATAQSPVGRAVYLADGLSPEAMDTVLVRLDGNILRKSDAVLTLVASFGGLWRGVSVFRLVPRILRDWTYDRIAGNRYRLFGKHDACPLPPPGLRLRFVDGGLS